MTPHSRGWSKLGRMTRYHCPECEAEIAWDEVSMMFDHYSNRDRPAHEGPEVTIGGDGYGGRCCGEMDVPKTHFVEVME